MPKKNSRESWFQMIDDLFGLDAPVARKQLPEPPQYQAGDPRTEVLDLLDGLIDAMDRRTVVAVVKERPRYSAEVDPEYQRLMASWDE